MPATIPTLSAMAAAVPRTILATVIPSSAEWPASLSAGVTAITSSSATAVPTTAAAATASQGLVAVIPSGATGATAVPAAVASPAMVGHLLGEGIAPLPPKLVKKITSLEFVEMADLLPEAWLLEETAMEAQLRRQRGPVTNILTWVQCFATFTSTLATVHPGKTPEMMAYMPNIVRCHRDYEGPAWVLYDRAFQRRAEVTKDLNWSVVNTSLFNLCFGGRARRRNICQVCLSESHVSERCPRRVLALGGTLAYSATIQGEPPYAQPSPMAVPYPPIPTAWQPMGGRWGGQEELCRLFNSRSGNRCRFPRCKFAHCCAKCRLPGHGAAQCTAALAGEPGVAGPSSKRPRLSW